MAIADPEQSNRYFPGVMTEAVTKAEPSTQKFKEILFAVMLSRLKAAWLARSDKKQKIFLEDVVKYNYLRLSGFNEYRNLLLENYTDVGNSDPARKLYAMTLDLFSRKGSAAEGYYENKTPIGSTGNYYYQHIVHVKSNARGTYFRIYHASNKILPAIMDHLAVLWGSIIHAENDESRYKALAEFEWWIFQANPMDRGGAAIGDAMSFIAQIETGIPLRQSYDRPDFDALSSTLGEYVQRRVKTFREAAAPDRAMGDVIQLIKEQNYISLDDLMRPPVEMIGEGSFAEVYKTAIPGVVVRIPHYATQLGPVEAWKDDFSDLSNLGYPIARMGDVVFLKEVNGIRAGIRHKLPASEQEVAKHYEFIAKMSESAYENFVRTIKVINNRGYRWEGSPYNLMIDQENGQFNVVDISKTDQTNSVLSLIEAVTDITVLRERYDRYQSLPDLHRIIVKKILKAAVKADFPLPEANNTFMEKLFTKLEMPVSWAEYHKALTDRTQITDLAQKGGIDLNPELMDLRTRSDGGAIRFNLDPVLMQKLEDAPGLTPVIIDIRPTEDLQMFLGLKEEGSQSTSS
jgi:hypothetical protein